jgi:hypothetical protein
LSGRGVARQDEPATALDPAWSDGSLERDGSPESAGTRKAEELTRLMLCSLLTILLDYLFRR